ALGCGARIEVMRGAYTLGRPARFAIVAARFNGAIVENLIAGALDALERHGVATDAVTLVRVPGSFELPPVAARLARSGKFDAVLALGADRKSTRLNSSHVKISYAVFCLKKKKVIERNNDLVLEPRG